MVKEYDFEEKKLADSEYQLQDGRSAKVVHSPEILTHWNFHKCQVVHNFLEERNSNP